MSWRVAVKDAGISGVAFRDFRGTFVTLAYRPGVAIKGMVEASGNDEKECKRVIRQHYLAGGTGTEIQKIRIRRSALGEAVQTVDHVKNCKPRG